jgi:hypothetical protein
MHVLFFSQDFSEVDSLRRLDEQLADALALLKDPHHDVVVTQSRLKIIDEDAASMSFSDRILSKIIKVFAKF